MGRSDSIPVLLLVSKSIPPNPKRRSTLEYLQLDWPSKNLNFTESADLYASPVYLHYRMLWQYAGILKQVDVALLAAANCGLGLVENELFPGQRSGGHI